MRAVHLSLATLERFVASELDYPRMTEVGKHLSACSSCRVLLRREVLGGPEVLHQLASRAWPGEQPNDYDQVFENLVSLAGDRVLKVRDDRAVAPALADQLMALPFAEQRRRIAESPCFRNAALADLLMERCAAISLTDGTVAEELSRLALDIADGIESDPGSRCLANDLRARAWASIGNLFRLKRELRTAEGAFAAAEAFLEEGSGDPLERARVLDLKVSLLRSQRRLDKALVAIDQVILIYRSVRETHRQGRALLSKALILGLSDEQEKSIALSLEALSLLDMETEPRLALAAFNNLLCDFSELGRYEEASALLPEVHRLLSLVATPADHTNVCWSEGKLYLAMGNLGEAEIKLRQVRDTFIAEDNGYSAAFASLELAKVFLLQGRTAETLELASTMHVIFTSRDIQREALVALMFFQQAAERELATVQLVDQVRAYLKKAIDDPGLRFDRPA